MGMMKKEEHLPTSLIQIKMEIKTKFQPLDQIYFIANNKKVIMSTVQGVKVEVREREKGSNTSWETDICYLCNDERSNVNIRVNENDAFESKEELLKSL